MAVDLDVNKRYYNALWNHFHIMVNPEAQQWLDSQPSWKVAKHHPMVEKRMRLALLRRLCGVYCYAYEIYTIVKVKGLGWALASVEDGICSDVERECSGLEITAKCYVVKKSADRVKVLEYDDVCR